MRYPAWSAWRAGEKHRASRGGHMDHAGRAVSTHGLPRVRQWYVRDWALWTLPRPLIVLCCVVTCGYLAWIGARASDFHLYLPNILLFAALLGCGAFSVEMTRRASEPDGVVKDVY